MQMIFNSSYPVLSSLRQGFCMDPSMSGRHLITDCSSSTETKLLSIIIYSHVTSLDNSQILPSGTAYNLGIVLDIQLSFLLIISKLTQSYNIFKTSGGSGHFYPNSQAGACHFVTGLLQLVPGRSALHTV